ncbi:MAG TPA: AMP-dependent synthetase/ligase [Actinomycetales bacterium]|nr:AMP-dependent synthetase/ligase [Actinomycetales bacterium]
MLERAVREYAVPALAEVAPSTNLTDAVVTNAARRPDAVAFRRKVGSEWQNVTARQFLTEVEQVAKGLVAAGIRPGDRVGLMSKTRYEWTLVDYAIWFAGAVTVPIYETSSAEQVAWILGDSGAVAAVVESEGHAETLSGVRGRLGDLRDVWCIERGALADLTAAGADVSDEDLAERRRHADLDTLATIIYTSGTTGRPKGCELTHGNFVVLARNATRKLEEVVEAEGASTLLFLPLAHVFARFIEVLCVESGAAMGHTPDVKNLVQDLGEFQPTFVLSVPRVFEKVYNSAEQKAESEGKGKIFRRAAEVAVDYSRSLDTGGPGLGLRVKHAVFDKLVYGKLRAALGGKAEYAVSGGAPLGERLGHFFRGIGLIVLEGYGLTETTAPTSVNLPEMVRIGTVGPPLPGTKAKIADDGEILLAGPHVFRGYWNNPAATADAFSEGWFKTGDLGEITDEGCLKVTGRKKEIIVTAGGKNVAPAVLEDRLRAHPLISQTIVVGDQQPFVAALVTLDVEMLPTWLANNGKPALTVEQAAGDEDVRAAIQAAVDEANQAVSRAESIRAFRVLSTDFTEESGHMTPSMKLKRAVVLKEFADDVNAIYNH